MGWRVDNLRRTVPLNFAGIGAKQAIDDLDERAFARTVFAQQCMDLTRHNSEADIVIGETAGKTFGDMREF
jgi:hypothetical protein